jgi:hypothetical protein
LPVAAATSALIDLPSSDVGGLRGDPRSRRDVAEAIFAAVTFFAPSRLMATEAAASGQSRTSRWRTS